MTAPSKKIDQSSVGDGSCRRMIQDASQARTILGMGRDEETRSAEVKGHSFILCALLLGDRPTAD